MPLHAGDSAAHTLRDVTFEVKRGERIAQLGKSGAGKSTLLHPLGRLDRATSGNVQLAGRDLGRLCNGKLSRFRSATVGIIL